MLLLGIETSCDETSASIVAENKSILSNVVFSQIEQHRPFGGVVPEIAARAHAEQLDYVIEMALHEAKVQVSGLDGISATAGPGLIGGVIVGLLTAKAIAATTKKPLIGINHLEGHALSVRLTNDIEFPYLLLLASGGHTQLLEVLGVGHYHLMGTTLDDASGECFDKVAKMLNLGFPGGPALESAAKSGDPRRFPLPRPMLKKSGFDFSFAGLKTAVLKQLSNLKNTKLTEQDVRDMASSFQTAVADVFCDRAERGLLHLLSRGRKNQCLVFAGGVAANSYIRNRLAKIADEFDAKFVSPPPFLCTDNGAMIAWAGIERLSLGLTDSMALKARARWSLSELRRY